MAKNLDEVLQDFVDWGTGWKTKAQAEQARGDSLESGLTDAQAVLAAERASDAETDAEQAAAIRAEAADKAQAVLDEVKAADVPAPPAEEPPSVPGDVTPGDGGGTTTPTEPADPLDPDVPVVPVDPGTPPSDAGDLPPETPVVEVPADTTPPVEVPPDAPVSPAGDLPADTPVVPVEPAEGTGGSTAPADTSIGQLPTDGGELSGIPGAGTVIGDVSQTGPAVDNPLGEPVEGSGTGQ